MIYDFTIGLEEIGREEVWSMDREIIAAHIRMKMTLVQMNQEAEKSRVDLVIPLQRAVQLAGAFVRASKQLDERIEELGLPPDGIV